MPEHGSLYSKNLRLVAHGSSTTHDNLNAVKEKIRREGFTRGTVQPVNSYMPLDSEGKESHNLPMVWVNQGEPRQFEVTKRGAFKWADSMAVY